jgi:hypothetical protein
MVIHIGIQSEQADEYYSAGKLYDAIQILLSITLRAAEDGLLLTACHHLYLIFFDLVFSSRFFGGWEFWGCFGSNLSYFRFEDTDSCTAG